MDESKVIYYLEIWQEYMRSHDSKLGYKKKSSGFLTGGISSVEDWEEDGDIKSAQIVDKCIDDLNPIERTSVNVRWLGERTLINPIMIDTHYGVALSKLAIKLQDNGLF